VVARMRAGAGTIDEWGDSTLRFFPTILILYVLVLTLWNSIRISYT
jgi:hypothetical protein